MVFIFCPLVLQEMTHVMQVLLERIVMNCCQVIIPGFIGIFYTNSIEKFIFRVIIASDEFNLGQHSLKVLPRA